MPTQLTQLQRVLALPDPQLTYKWINDYIPFIDSSSSVVMESIDLPFNNINIGEAVHFASGYDYFAGTHNISSFSAAFYEDNKASAHKWIAYWKSRVKNFNTGVYGLPYGPKGYKQNISVTLLDQKNEKVMTVKLLGCWPAETAAMQLNYTDANGRITLSQTFSCDDQDITYFK